MINKVLGSGAGTILAIGLVGAVAIYYAEKRAGQAVAAINPVDENNIFNQGVLAVGQSITGNENWTLGGAIYDATH